MSEHYFTLARLYSLSRQFHARSWVWFLDIDGTLLDIAPSPLAVTVPDDLIVSLNRLAESPRHRIALISGRSLADIDQFFPNPLFSKSGNHGAEYYCNNKTWLHYSSRRFLAVRPRVLDTLASLPEQFPGLFIEDKQYSLSVHYRHVNSSQHALLSTILRTRLSSVESITIHPAKLCWEIRPDPGPTKADAVQRLYNQISPQLPKPTLPVIMGDDRTDEDAFGAVNPAVTIHVGNHNRPTQALYRINSPQQVRDLITDVSRAACFFAEASLSPEDNG